MTIHGRTSGDKVVNGATLKKAITNAQNSWLVQSVEYGMDWQA
jgi:hypothetical protein